MIKVKQDTILVKKTSGKLEPFNIDKIKKQIQFAIKPTALTFDEVWGKIAFEIRKDKISTKEIQNRLIKSLAKYITKDMPEYNLIVGRLYMWNIYRQVWKNTSFDKAEWQDHLIWLVEQKFYKSEIQEYFKNLSNSTIEWINKKVIYENNEDFTKVYIQAILADKKGYLLKHNKRLIEYPFLANISNALILSEGDNKLFQEYFNYLQKDVLSLATPFRKGLRLRNTSLGSCFIGETDDNLASLTKTYADISFISKYGGGIGWYLSKIRPEGTSTNNVLKSVKINKWAKVLNDIIVATTQGGGSRKGAITLALDWWHLDIFSFLSIKSELDGDLRDKCFDIFPQVVVDNWFIEKAKNKEEVALFNHYEYKKRFGVDITELIGEELYKHYEKAYELVKNKKLQGKILKANELWKKILWVWVEIGDFYIVNRDNLNLSNYLKDFGITKCSNLCTESFSLTKVATQWKERVVNEKRDIMETDGIYHSCNLLSINVGNLVEASDEEKKRVIELAVMALDTSINLSDAPTLEAQTGSLFLRNIGIGYVGVADYLAYHKKTLNDDGIKEVEKLIEFFTYYAYKASIKLAKKYGSYPLFEKADYSKILGRDPEELNKLSLNNLDWVELQKEIQQYGIRNALLIAIAPNTSTGGLCNATASCFPVYNKEMYQTFAELSVPVIPKYIKERYWYYKTKWQYTPEEIIKYVRSIQKWVDTGISMEVNINPELTNIKKISDAIIDGFLSKELKTVYYSMTIGDKKRDSGCTDCAN